MLNGITQQFTQGSYEASEKTLDMAIVGEGMFTVVKGDPPRERGDLHPQRRLSPRPPTAM